MSQNSGMTETPRTNSPTPALQGLRLDGSQLDPFSAFLDLKGEILKPGHARILASLKAEHLNTWGSAHGGFLYTMADMAFSLAANSHGVLAVALSTHMEYLEPVQPGDPLEAEATEVRLGGRTGVYRVEIRSGERLIAQFTGTAYRHPKQKSWLAELQLGGSLA